MQVEKRYFIPNHPKYAKYTFITIVMLQNFYLIKHVVLYSTINMQMHQFTNPACKRRNINHTILRQTWAVT